MRWAEPGWLILLTLAPVPWLLARTNRAIAWPTLDGFHAVGRRAAGARGAVPFLLRGAAIVCVVVALARPRTVGGRSRIAGRGVSIVVALDQSSSMNAADFPDGPGRPPIARLVAARRTLARFVAGRPDDLIGLVVFANYPDLACPLTLDHAFLLDTVRSIRPARPGDDGTNLGDALVWALDALKNAPTREKVLILIGDGRNSPAVPRPTDPSDAATLARRLGVTLHTVAIGSAGPNGPDFALLARLAAVGAGRAFAAADAEALGRVFATIDALEKSPIRGVVRTRYREEYAVWAVAALALVAADRLLASGRLRRLP